MRFAKIKYTKQQKTVTNHSFSPIKIIHCQQKDILIYLIDHGAILNKMSNQKTPLMYAAKYGNLEIAKLLIQKGANKNIINPKAKTALGYAKKYKQFALIPLLSE